MKLLSLTFCLLLTVASAGWSQHSGPALKILLQPNFSNIHLPKDRAGNYDFKMSGTASVQLRYKLSRQLSLNFGLAYINKGYQYTVSNLRFGSQHNGNGGFDPSVPSGEDFDSFKSKQNYNYAGLPVSLTYRLKEAPTALYFLLGCTPVYHLSTVAHLRYSNGGAAVRRDKQKQDRDLYRKLNAELTAGIGKAFSISEKLSFFMEVRADWSLLQPVVDTSSKRGGLYAFGVGAGVVIH